MPGDHYPLAALLELRRRIKQEQEQCLAQAVLAVEQAEGERQKLLAAARAAAERLQAARDQRSLAPGESANAIQQQFNYEQRLQLEREQADKQVCQAEEQLQRYCKQLEQVRTALIQAERELKLVAQHQAKWDRARQEREQRRAELELEDLLAARSNSS